ncbi:MAG: EamA family transporter [Leptolyngbyaceae cyanobacterium SL_5_9]|nr:EamA family transporter [Leptolyngbyaceae cyanobacterium SL_5_9]
MQSAIYPQSHDAVLNPHFSSFTAFITQKNGQLQTWFGSIPPSSLVLLTSFAAQAGTATSKQLFEALGPIGAVFICKAIAALLMLLIWRPQLQNRTWREYVLVAGLGLAIAGLSLAFYGAIARIPLGIASALDFVGPLSVAVLGSRRLRDLVWVILAATGVILLTPMSGASLDPLGVTFGLLSAGSWAGFILLSAPVGRAFSGGSGLSLAMAIATLIMLPIGIHAGGSALLKPSILLLALGIAILGVVLPYSLEFKALSRLPPRVYGVLISIEPAIAALVGLLFLGEQLESRNLVAIAMVTTAAMGVTLLGSPRNL